ncbi:hypothetical protein AB0L86_23100 [Micromonospora musae]|uniref:hypothetical protein n=1 Tax=Micromonospora musae TaxID=1894970 RepID=UPI00342B38D6
MALSILRWGWHSGLGIVTELQVRLVPLASLYGGRLTYASADVPAVLRGWFDWTRTADPRVSTSALLSYMPDPRIDDPRPQRGLTLRVAFPGRPDEGQRLTAPLRALGAVIGDTVDQMPAREIPRIHDDPVDPGPAWIIGAMFTHADTGLTDRLLDLWGPSGDLPFPAAEIRHLSAAAGIDITEGSAATGRGAAFLLGTAGVDPETFYTALPAAADRIRAALATWLSAEHNPNFAGRPSASGGGAPAWPSDIASRLAQIRHRYDPEQVIS